MRQTLTPDILPIVELNDDGLPVVTWKGMSDGKTVDLVSVWDGAGWSKAVVSTEDDSPKQDTDSDADMVELADFMPASGLVFLRVY